MTTLEAPRELTLMVRRLKRDDIFKVPKLISRGLNFSFLTICSEGAADDASKLMIVHGSARSSNESFLRLSFVCLFVFLQYL